MESLSSSSRRRFTRRMVGRSISRSSCTTEGLGCGFCCGVGEEAGVCAFGRLGMNRTGVLGVDMPKVHPRVRAGRPRSTTNCALSFEQERGILPLVYPKNIGKVLNDSEIMKRSPHRRFHSPAVLLCGLIRTLRVATQVPYL